MMMMIGDSHRSNPTVQIPPWDNHHHYIIGDPTANILSPDYDTAFTALQRYLPSNTNDEEVDGDDSDDFDLQVDAFSCDNFRMFDFKVKKCSRARSHDWTECPFAHPGEKARRRDPRKYHYSGTACPDFRKGECKRGDLCEHAHGVFECWLHPARYRTQPCKDGTHCHRRVCFFAHTPEQLRVLPDIGYDPFMMFGSSPKSTLYSPPMSPQSSCSPPISPFGMRQLAESMRAVQLNKVKMGVGFGSGRGLMSPIQSVRGLDTWGKEEEPMMERVESGRKLRESLYEKLGRENSLDRVGRQNEQVPDFEWVSKLVQ